MNQDSIKINNHSMKYSIFLLSSFLMAFNLPAQEFEFEWKQILGSSENIYLLDMEVGSMGDMYVTGWFNGKDVQLGEFQISATGGKDMFIAKVNQEGKVVWVKTAQGSGNEYGTQITLDTSDNVYVKGRYEGINMTFSEEYKMGIFNDNPNLEYHRSHEAPRYVAKYDPEGNLQWATSNYTGKNSSHITPDCFDEDGNFYFTVGFKEYLSIGGDHKFRARDRDFILMKRDPDGNLMWVKHFTGEMYEDIQDIKYADGFLYLSVKSKSANMQVDGLTLKTTNRAYDDTYIVKISKEGEIKWTTSMGGRSNMDAVELRIAKDGRIFGAGYHGYDAFTSMMNSEGKLQWVTLHGSAGLDLLSSMVLLEDSSKIFALGAYQSTRWFGDWYRENKINPSPRGRDVWLISCDTEKGEMTQFIQFSGAGRDNSVGVKLYDENLLLGMNSETGIQLFKISLTSLNKVGPYMKYSY